MRSVSLLQNRTRDCYVVIVCTFLALTCTAFFVFFAFWPRWNGRSMNESRRFCCPELLDPLVPMVNLTLDPCQEPFHYVCHRWKQQSAHSTPSFTVKNAFSSVLQGTDLSESGHTLHRIYMSCISAVGSPEPIEKTLIRGILEVLSPLIVPPYRLDNNLRLILTLSLIYRAFRPIYINAERTGDDYHLEFVPGNSMFMEFLPEDNEGSKTAVLERLMVALNEESKFNLSIAEVLTIGTDISHFGRAEPHVAGNLSLLEGFVPQGAPSTFKSVLEKIHPFPKKTKVVVQSYIILRKILQFLVDPANQPKAVLYAIFEATVTFFLQLQIEDLKPYELFNSCVEYVKNFRILMFIHYAKKLSNPVRDRLVVATVERIKSIMMEKLSLLVDKSDIARMSNTLSELRVVVPSYVAQLINFVHDVSSNLFSNFLQNEAWNFQMRLSDIDARMSLTNIISRPPYEGYVIVTNNHLFIAPVVLGLVSSDKPEAHFERCAAIGPVVSDTLWKLILEDTTWSATSEVKLARLRTCASETGSIFRYPALSVQTAAWTARDTTWLKRVFIWSLWEASTSQVFYLRYIYHVACLRLIGGRESENQVMADVAFVAFTPSFRKAFDCPLSFDNNETCGRQIDALE